IRITQWDEFLHRSTDLDEISNCGCGRRRAACEHKDAFRCRGIAINVSIDGLNEESIIETNGRDHALRADGLTDQRGGVAVPLNVVNLHERWRRHDDGPAHRSEVLRIARRNESKVG